MSKLSYLEKLLDGTGVEWKPLGDDRVGEFIRGGGLQKKDFTETGVGCIHYGQIYTHYGIYADKTKTFVSKEFAKKARKAKSGDLVIATTSENDEDVCKAVAWLGKEDIAVSSDACIYRHNLNPKYVSYFFQTEQFQKQKRPYITGTKVRRVNADDLSKIPIPIPCPENQEKSLMIQAEIVRILDAFTQLTAELTAELTARKKQYSYYRDLFLLSSSLEKKKLGDISDIYLGLTYTPTYVDNGVKFISAQNTSKDFLDLSNVKYISANEYQKSTSNAKPKRGDVLFTRVGSNLGHPVIVDTDEPLCMFVSLGFIRVNQKKVLNSYIKHWMNTDLFWDQVSTKVYGAAKINLNTGWLKEFDVPLPSLTEQARIISILNKFDTLTTSLSEGLPHEIELRKKQYEYYRDLLLSFPKLEELAA
jgi:type I restriction enzyme S subunit